MGVGRLVLPRPFALIGRDRRADLMLDHDLVSRRHAFLVIIEGWPFFIDLESRSGSSLEDSPPREWGWLRLGQTLQIGPYRIRQADPDSSNGISHEDGWEAGLSPPANPLLPRSGESGDLPRVALQFESRGSSSQSVWKMSQVMAVLGNSARCKVRLYDPNISKQHCALLRTPSGLWAIDLLGREGITVNGELVRFAPLREGDELGLGRIVVRPTFSDRLTRSDAASPWGGGISFGNGPPARISGAGWASPPAAMPAAMNYPGAAPSPFPSAFHTNGQAPNVSTQPLPPLNPNEPALAMLLNHFGQMQQQMADQFQQQMMFMLQMFNGMHREQMGVIREELDRLRELSMEVQSLRTQMAALPPNRPTPRPGVSAPSTASAWLAKNPIPASPIPPRPAPAPSSPPPSGPARAPSAATHPAAGPGSADADSVRGPIPRGEPLAKPATPPPDGSNLDPEVHDWLNDRLVAIQNEQQTRWQKILGMLGQRS
jgi:pSer/pThr/pTyr-binding forkhead associated (FHA) protein